jgi:hypothetical protein
MSRTQKKILNTLVILGVIYLFLFIPANMTGARDPAMLSLFEVDEYAQYPHLVRMLTTGDAAYQTLRNFVVYLHYYYGYLFYFFSALSVLPVRILFGDSWTSQTWLIVLVLRQAINVLPMVLALGILTWVQTRFRSTWKSIGLFLFMLILPGVVVNNLWWHPDSLVFLFIVLTIFFLERDHLNFNRNFFLAAFSCGLAIGTKHLGVFFGLTILGYLLLGVLQHKISWKRSLSNGTLFILVMLGAIIVSNPLLVLPQERMEIIRIQRSLFGEASVGIVLANQASLFEGGWPNDVRVHYGGLLFFVLASLGLAWGIREPSSRLRSLIILTWLIPLSIVIINFGTRRTHYFLPVALPLISSLVHLFPDITEHSIDGWKQKIKPVFVTLLAMAILYQSSLFIRTNISIYKDTIQRENDAPGIIYYNELQKEVLPDLPDGEPITIYRDWHIYFPDGPSWNVEMDWNFATYEMINDLKPDLVLLENENLTLFGDPSVVEQAANPVRMARINEFYSDASTNDLPGYHLVFQNDFATAFLSDRFLYQTRD